MLLQTNSYIVPKDRRSEHARLLRKFRQTLARLGCDQFEVYEQVGANWAGGEATGRFVQIMRFRDRKHQQEVQAGEKTDPVAQQLIQEFCALINFPYQQQQGLFAVGFYTSSLQASGARTALRPTPAQPPASPAGDASQPVPGAVAESTAAPATGDESADLTSETFDLLKSDAPEREGASLLDFAGLAPEAAEEPTPLRLTPDDNDDTVIESEIASADVSSESAPPAPVEDSENGEHAGSFSDAPQEAMLDLVGESGSADEDLVSEADREAVLGELLDDNEERGRRRKAD